MSGRGLDVREDDEAEAEGLAAWGPYDGTLFGIDRAGPATRLAGQPIPGRWRYRVRRYFSVLWAALLGRLYPW